jgi:actin-like ATPase involved in cell morphogenesis
VRVGSFDIDAAIQAHVRREHGLAIGERTAEEIKISIGSAIATAEDRDAEVRGRDLVSGLPKTVVLTSQEIRDAIEEVVSQMVASVIRCLAVAPPELSQDFLSRGMYLVGGGSMLRGLAQRIERDTCGLDLFAVAHEKEVRDILGGLQREDGPFDEVFGAKVPAHCIKRNSHEDQCFGLRRRTSLKLLQPPERVLGG